MNAKRPYKKRKKRVGCGIGSGHGKRACRGQKGQKSRSGSSMRPGFEGGQNPLYRRLPKRGFNHDAFRREFRIVNIAFLASLTEKEITPDTLVAKGLIKNMRDGLKVLGTGEIQKAVNVSAHSFSVVAKEKILKAGGQAILIES